MLSWRRYPGLLRAAALLLGVAVAWVPSVWFPGAVSKIEESVGDFFWRQGAGSRAERRVVLVDIDEKSLQEIGPWPWPRSTVAELAARLNEAEVRVQAYDITFSEPRTGDAALQTAWAAGTPVLAQLFSLDPAVRPQAGSLSGSIAGPACPPHVPQAYGYYGTSESLAEAHAAVGHINAGVSVDGVVRHIPAIVCYAGRSFSSLTLTTLWQVAQPTQQGGQRALAAPDWQWHTSADASPSPFAWALAPAAWLSSPSLPGMVVPLDAQGSLRVPYGLTRDAFMVVPVADVLKGRADMDVLRGAIVIVGATAFGIGDTVATPHGSVASGIEVHTQALVGMLDHALPYTPASWRFGQALLTALFAVALLSVGLRRRGVPAKRLPLTGLLLAALCLAAAGVSLLQFNLWLPWFGVVTFALAASLLLATVEHAFARAQRERLSAHLGAYLPAPVAQRLMATEPSGKLQLEPRQVSVLATELRNFGAMATHRPADEVAALLHAYCCMVVDVVEKHHGVVENVVGDSITALWTSSAECPDHHQQALSAARELVQVTRALLASSQPVSESSPVQPLALGVGVESGVAIVGSFGPARRRAHAALGEPVSVACRIQQMTAELSMPILIGPNLAGQLASSDLEPQGEYLLEGLAKHYQLYAPVGWSDLIAVDSNWATSAAGQSERQTDFSEWSRWGNVSNSSGASNPGTLSTVAAFRRSSV